MAKLIGVYDQADEPNLKLGRRQVPIPVDDNKIMVMQLSDICESCQIAKLVHNPTNRKRNKRGWQDNVFEKQYLLLTREEVLAALMVPSKTIFTRLAQMVGCVGCRRSVEQLFNQLRDCGHPALEPLVVTNSGFLSVLMKYSLQPRELQNLFLEHGISLSDLLDSIPKFKKSGRCLLHSMDGVRCRPGSQSWQEMWESMTNECRLAITLVNSDHLLMTLDNYLRKHRFCHECKNKVHRAYNILVGNVNPDTSKEKGFVASLFSGIKRCESPQKHIHINADTEYVMNLITRAEPELQGRRERHAKTLEIAQEEVLTCLGLFLYERLQRIHMRMREEEQTWDILFHIGLDALKKNFELAVENKQGFSKFELLCEELQRQELREKAKKEKKKKKKNKKKEERKENDCMCNTESSCKDCDSLSRNSSPLMTNVGGKELLETTNVLCRSALPASSLSRCRGREGLGAKEDKDDCNLRKGLPAEKEEGKMALLDISTDGCPHHHTSHYHHSHKLRSPSHHLGFSASMDSLASKGSQCSRDGGYCSAQCSGTSSRESSDIACGEGYCSHADDLETNAHADADHLEKELESSNHQDIGSCEDSCRRLQGSHKFMLPFKSSLQQMLDDSSCEADEIEIPEAEVRAWKAHLGAVREKRAELRQTLKQRFQQLCHRTMGVNGCSVSVNGVKSEEEAVLMSSNKCDSSDVPTREITKIGGGGNAKSKGRK